MNVDPFHGDCLDEQRDLTLLETRFERQRRFMELQCRVCQALWTAEIGPTSKGTDPLAMGTEDQPRWRVFSLEPCSTN